jgi:hypothetical protein
MPMRISINAQERELALLGLDLADKDCETTRRGLERLRQEHFGVMALQGHIGTLRRALKDTKRRIYDWSFDDRRAVATGLHIYREQVAKLATREGKLLVETSATDERVTDVKDFLARLAGQESLFTEAEHAAEVAPLADAPATSDAGVALTPQLASAAAEELGLLADDSLEWLKDVAGLLERGAVRLTEDAFRTLATAALPRAAHVVPGFDGTRHGGYLLGEVLYDEVNAMVLASWIRTQLDEAAEAETPVRLSAEQVNEIRKTLGKDPLEEAPAAHQEREVAILAENTARNPIDVRCRHCGAGPKEPCQSVGDKIVGSAAHAERMKDVGMWGDARKIELANAFYLDDVIYRVFNRPATDELRIAVKKRRTIDLNARWVQTVIADGGAHAHA